MATLRSSNSRLRHDLKNPETLLGGRREIQHMGTISAKYAILGDIHSNLEALTAVLEDAQGQGCTHFACVGDLVGYNANPRECLQIVRDLGMSCVKGNHDEYAGTNDSVAVLSSRAAAAMTWTRSQLEEAEKAWLRTLRHVRIEDGFTMVHASLDGPASWPYVFDRLAAASNFSYQRTALCFYGHTHLPKVFIRDGSVREAGFTSFKVEPGLQYFVNVGSVGEPRDGGLSAAYVTYEPGNGDVELRRVSYDSALTEAKLLEAGLPTRRKR